MREVEVLGERMENVNKMNFGEVCVRGGLKVNWHYPCQQGIFVVDCECVICRDYSSTAFGPATVEYFNHDLLRVCSECSIIPTRS